MHEDAGLSPVHRVGHDEGLLRVERVVGAMSWKPISTAPHDGTEIYIKDFGQTDDQAGTAVWSQRPVCMLGPVNGGYPPGWATGPNSGTDNNLPLDTPDLWREME